MPLVLASSVVALTVVAAGTVALTSRLARSLLALRSELDALAGLRVARDRLAHDLDQTRRFLDRPTDRPADAGPSGLGR